MQSKDISRNMLKYVAVLALTGYFTRGLNIPNYGVYIVIRETSKLSHSQINMITTIGCVLGAIFLVIGGILADKHGRRLTWALFLVLYEIGMLWLFYSHSFEIAMVAAALMGSSFMFNSSSLAWFFDFEGKEGLRKAHGFLRIIYAILIVIGIMNLIFFKKSLTSGHYAVLTGIIAISSACWVMTFQENYGSRSSPYVEIFKTGIKEVFSSKVLLLVVVSSIFIDFQFWIPDYSFFFFLLEKFQIPLDEITLVSGIAAIPAVLAAGIFVLVLKKTDYKLLIIYPMIFALVFYLLIPFAPTSLFFFTLGCGASAFSRVASTGVLILVNDSIFRNRATCLSLMTLLLGIPTLLHPLWKTLFTELGLETSAVVAGASAAISIFVLYSALRIHAGDSSHLLQHS